MSGFFLDLHRSLAHKGFAKILYYFSNQNDLVLDPTRPPRLRESNGGQVAGGGGVADTCQSV
ncbi:MAG: hypothetical protein U9R02_15890 [Thermodesulfobacteriota bacterium]|nr:hypothetical protein [Thermodesulfobacteriota bacterium]